MATFPLYELCKAKWESNLPLKYSLTWIWSLNRQWESFDMDISYDMWNVNGRIDINQWHSKEGLPGYTNGVRRCLVSFEHGLSRVWEQISFCWSILYVQQWRFQSSMASWGLSNTTRGSQHSKGARKTTETPWIRHYVLTSLQMKGAVNFRSHGSHWSNIIDDCRNTTSRSIYFESEPRLIWIVC